MTRKVTGSQVTGTFQPRSTASRIARCQAGSIEMPVSGPVPSVKDA